MRYPIEPCPKPRMTRRDKWKKRPCVMKYRAFKDKCALYRVQLPQPCLVIFHIPMPKSWGGYRSAHVGEPHQRRPDIDNLLKGLMDAVLKRDEKIWNVRTEKRWAMEGAIEVIPLEVDPPSIDSPWGP